MELNPVTGTYLGDHRWDDRLGQTTLAAMESQNREMHEALTDFQGMDLEGFGLDGRIDHTLVTQILKSFIRGYERIQGHLRNPGSYLDEATGGVFLLIVRDFAPLPERLRSALERMRDTPRVLRDGRSNIVPKLVPRVWAETALEQAQQAPGLFSGLLPSLAAEAAPDLLQDITDAGQSASQAIEEYAAFLEEEVLPRAEGDFAAGKGLFDEMLREDHMVDYDADRLLEVGWEQFRQTQTQMKAVARQIDPARSAQGLLEEAKADHPTAQGLLSAYEEAMSSARRYVVEHGIASLPEGETLRIVETPPYLRPILPYAAYMAPGILEDRQEGIFLVTPVDTTGSPDEQEQKLRGHFRANLPVIALHEAYPGHHLQLVWANRQEQVARRMGSFLADLFIEGWAFYCEEMMEQLGYIAEPIQRLGRLSDQLWRAARIILDASLHTRGMTVDDAVSFLVSECQLEPTNALAEVRRYTQTPTQPQSYLMGKLAIVELVDEIRRANPGASLREIHDAILMSGSLPPRLMRLRLLG